MNRTIGLWVFMALVGVVFVSPQSALAHDFGGSTQSQDNDTNRKRPENRCKRRLCCPKRPNSGGPSSPGFGGSSAGKPFDLLDGNEEYSYVDLMLGTGHPILLVRRYDSQSDFDTALGYGWAFEHDRRLFEYPDGSITIRTTCGDRSRFVLTGGTFVTPRDGLQGELAQQPNGSYVLRYADGSRDVFDADGRLVEAEDPTGWRQAFTYDSRGKLPLTGTSPYSIDPNQPLVVAMMPRLVRIELLGPGGALTGHAVDFTYDEPTGRLTGAQSSDGRTLQYSHDVWQGATRGNLISVTSNDGEDLEYRYEDPVFPHRLTWVRDGAGADPVVTLYDGQGRVILQTWGTSRIDVEYLTPQRTRVSTRIVGDTGQLLHTAVRTVEFDEAGYYNKETNALGDELRLFYDSQKNVSRSEVWQSTPTGLMLAEVRTFQHDTQGQRLSESVELEDGSTITTSWTYDHGWVGSEVRVWSSAPDDEFRTEYSFVRDAAGVPTNIAAERRYHHDGSFVVTSYAYCTAADAANPATHCPIEGLLKTVTGPRTDVTEITSYQYYTSTNESGCGQPGGACYRRGDLWRVVNPLGHVTEFARYDRAGRVVETVDPNGTVTTMAYHTRGWLLERREIDPNGSSATTTYEYDARGNTTKVVGQDGDETYYEYDGRDRRIAAADGDGHRISLAYDSEGNVLRQEIRDAQNQVWLSATRSYDLLGRQSASRDSQGRAISYSYDALGRTRQIEDPLGRITEQQYDRAGRMVATIQDVGGLAVATTFGYDAVDNLIQVTDPKGLDTVYVYDALGRLEALHSPDTGIALYTYDEAGNRTSQTDARGVTATYTYDALNRLTAIEYPDASLNVAYHYDEAAAVSGCDKSAALGRLSRMIDAGGTTTYCYDGSGRTVEKRQAMGAGTFTVGYAYDASGRLTGLTYPSGEVVGYARDDNGRIASVHRETTSKDPVPLVNQVSYLPLGPPTAYAFANGQTLSKHYDQDYRTIQVGSPALALAFELDAMGNIVASGQAPGQPAEQYSYDGLDRLSDVLDGAGSVLLDSFDYDATGNRTLRQRAGDAPVPYTYPANSHRLASVGGVGRSYDAMGNTVQGIATSTSLAYGDHGRLSSWTPGTAQGQALYTYNGHGERVAKILPQEICLNACPGTLFVYDEAGRLLGEYDLMGQPKQEHVWADDTPVAVLRAGESYYVHSDHLNTPRAIADKDGNLRWRWAFADNAFGERAAEEDPENEGPFEYHLRFPGQYFDAESGLHYNYFRDYDPSTGRYIESDPIGLDGGINTYAYVESRPLDSYDPTGEAAITLVAPLPAAGAGTSGLCLPCAGAFAGGFIAGSFVYEAYGTSIVDAIFRVTHGKWTCAASCNVQQIDPLACCPPRTTGVGGGSNQNEACRNAKRDATQSTPRGCYSRHCQCSCYKN
ncbi:MAG TPA: RHS repeat-associated core domain-containing protein [Xanthomonadaceae bacterium]|nr:RHS repeat-associated core domain-containing protein [Xanthomonadaceae bacterium]